ncbi:uncharacterized protein A4U43_C08F29980 [Asparagus officinalis]|nr:uncharacterized protein A4U43_C08F29980 [Asparagus officinalis]
MSFSRSRRPPIIDPNPNFKTLPPSPLQIHGPRHGRRSQYNPNPSRALLPFYPRKQNRDRAFVDPDTISAAPPLKRSGPMRVREWMLIGGPPAEEATAEAAAVAADFMSRDQIERCSPSRRDGIDLLMETHLRYSYCSYLQCLGMRLELPQTTIGTAMVLCHRFFVRRSHASHDRFHDWFDQYRERVIEAEQMILMTLDFELDVHHPYVPLTSVLSKLGLSQSALQNLAWNLVSEGLRSSLWLQFKPHHIAAGATFLAARFLNFDLSYYPSIWHEFKTSPSILQDVVQQLMELF